MGRELKRKEAKRNGTNVKKASDEIDTGIETLPLVKLTIIVVSILAILYLFLAIFVTDELDLSTEKEEETENTNDEGGNNTILASSIFKQSGETYYVFFYDFKNKEEVMTASSVSYGITDHIVYTVDTGSGLNKNYVSDTSNPNVTSIENLKVKSPTLIKISADKVTLYLEGTEQIKSYLTK